MAANFNNGQIALKRILNIPDEDDALLNEAISCSRELEHLPDFSYPQTWNSSFYPRSIWSNTGPSTSSSLSPMDMSFGSFRSFNQSGSFSDSFRSLNDQEKSILLEKLIIEQRARESLISEMLSDIKFQDLSEDQKLKMKFLRVQDFSIPETKAGRRLNERVGLKKTWVKDSRGRTNRTRDHNSDKSRKKLAPKGRSLMPRKKVRFERGIGECSNKPLKSCLKKPKAVENNVQATNEKDKEKKVVEYETNATVLARRRKDIEYGKNTVGYERYIELVPKYVNS